MEEEELQVVVGIKMVGEECDAEWLGSHLAIAGGLEAGVLVLDCRSLAEYRAGHIVGAIHLMIPTLMLRRLRTGCLPVESVINCQDARERFSRHWKTKTLVLNADDAEDASGGTEDGVGWCLCDTAEAKGLSAVSVVSLLYHRLKEDGCKVTYLKGRLKKPAALLHLTCPCLNF